MTQRNEFFKITFIQKILCSEIKIIWQKIIYFVKRLQYFE